MEAAQGVKDLFTIDDAVNVLFSKLGEAIDDMEKGNIISEEELWATLDTI